ncbi:hypothetical protein JQ615_30950 [Bradyrhizobium jicamae]|uniref:Uncharacterized protein n=1 Tax=Bradyrhizobium jicamae TaxID=280332 RepID=A0ABS5FSQ0_9BRAD|nr:hypothetical protein [Bradyrhizobium jicamae]MBR0799799.1 hypothetical protein [Bradyrhizobium jicamae]
MTLRAHKLLGKLYFREGFTHAIIGPGRATNEGQIERGEPDYWIEVGSVACLQANEGPKLRLSEVKALFDRMTPLL